MPSIEKVRMVSSGTEATLDTLRLARGYTGKIKSLNLLGVTMVIVILIIKAGSGVATLGLPDSRRSWKVSPKIQLQYR